jgi:hypothetical protein
MRGQADLNRCAACEVLRAVDSPLRGYKCIQGGFEELWEYGAGSAEEPAILQRHGQGVSDPHEDPEILTFLYLPRVVCSPLLHLLNSWQGFSPEFVRSRRRSLAVLGKTPDVRGGLLGRDPALRAAHLGRVAQRILARAGAHLRLDRLASQPPRGRQAMVAVGQ